MLSLFHLPIITNIVSLKIDKQTTFKVRVYGNSWLLPKAVIIYLCGSYLTFRCPVSTSWIEFILNLMFLTKIWFNLSLSPFEHEATSAIKTILMLLSFKNFLNCLKFIPEYWFVNKMLKCNIVYVSHILAVLWNHWSFFTSEYKRI